MNPLSYFHFLRHPRRSRAGKHSPLPVGPRSRLELEALEDRCLLSGNVISGHVFLDANNNGRLDPGETLLANSTIQLRNSSGVVVGTAVTDVNGAYAFATDSTISTAPTTLTRTLNVSSSPTDWSKGLSVAQFDPSLGLLTAVEVVNGGSFTSQIRVESLDGAPSTITANNSGALTLAGPGLTGLVTPTATARTFQATAFDGVIDFGGTSGHDFGAQVANGSNATTLTDAASLAAYTGTGFVGLTETAHATSGATGAGNMIAQISTSASAQVSVVYHYIPSNALKSGNYTLVQISQPTGLLEGLESSNGSVLPNSVGTDVIPVTLAATDVPGNDFAELSPANLSGFVYVDPDNNGVMEPGEAGLAGVTVTLTGSNDLGTVSLTTSTGADGSYQFQNLRPGTYTISESQPAGYLPGKNSLGSLGGFQGNNQFSAIALGEGVAGVNYNFGELLAPRVSGFVYLDGNNNGTKDAGEPGISGVTLTLTGTNDLGNPVNQTQVTAADGSYSFNYLRPGTYAVSETPPAGYLDGKQSLGSVGGTPGTHLFSGITLVSGVVGVNYNFGELLPARLAGFVYVDANNNGVKDAGEAGLSGVTVTLIGTNDLGSFINQAQTTAADGSYSFEGLRPGSYAVLETQPAGYLDGKDALGSAGGTPSNDQFTGIPLASSVSAVNYNFGELLPGSLAGFVYLDANNDGVKGAGEAGLAGVSVTLSGTNDLGNAVSQAQATAADGSYHFQNLRPGTYTVTETTPAGYLDGTDALGSAGGTPGNDQFANIPLGVGVGAVNYNFGELLPAGVSGFVYVDPNNNGVKEGGEPGLGGVTVTLTGTNDLGAALSQTQTTAADGSYSFQGLRPGTYSVTEAQPAGYLAGKESVGSAGGTQGNNQFTSIPLGQGVSGVNYNFGELPPASLAGFVYLDGNNNGLKEDSESGIANVTVTLTGTDDQGAAVSAGQTTGSDGSYHFVNLRPGTYTLSDTQPAQYVAGKLTLGTAGGNVGGAQFVGIGLGAGVAGVRYNFGELLPPNAPGQVSGGNPTTNTSAYWQGFSTTATFGPPLPLSIVSKLQFLASTGSNTLPPDVQAAATYVNSLYLSILGRGADEAGLVAWVTQLLNGAPRGQVVHAIEASAEHLGQEVARLYHLFLHRDPDPMGATAFLNLLLSGGSEADAARMLVASPEYGANHLGNNSYVAGLYQDVLGRPGSATDIANWGQVLSSGVSRDAVAVGFLTSRETYLNIVDQAYLNILGRGADQAGESGWVGVLLSGQLTPEAVTEAFYASDEFYARAQHGG